MIVGFAAAAGDIHQLRNIAGICCVEIAPGHVNAIRTAAGALLGEPGTLRRGWQAQFLYAGFAPVYLLAWRDPDGNPRTWYLDREMRVQGEDEPPPEVCSVLRETAAPLLLGLWEGLLCAPRPALERRARGLHRLGDATIARLLDICARALPTRLAAVDLEPLRGSDRVFPVFDGTRHVSVRAKFLFDILDEPLRFIDRAVAGFHAGEICWPSPVDGAPLGTDAVLLMEILHCAYRLVDRETGLIFYVYAAGEEGRVAGVLFPAARRVFGLGSNPSWAALPQLGERLLRHLCRYAEPLAAHLRAERRTLGCVVHGHHHGHVLFEDLAGLDELAHRLPEARLPEIDMRRPGGVTEAGEVYGPIERLFPAFAGKVHRHADFSALIGAAYAHRRSLLRLAPQYLRRRLAERVVAVNLSRPELAAERARLAAIRAKGWPLALIDLRVENRTLVDLAGFCSRLLEFLLGAAGRLAVVLAGHTGAYRSPMDLYSKRSAVAVQHEIVTSLRRAFAGRPLELIDIIGEGMARAIFWSRAADFFVAPWGANLVVYRWLANKPGLILTNRWGLMNHGRGPGVDFFCSPRYMEAPGPVSYIAPEHVEDAPEATIEFWTDHPLPSVYNFRVDETAVFAEVARLLGKFGPAGDSG